MSGNAARKRRPESPPLPCPGCMQRRSPLAHSVTLPGRSRREHDTTLGGSPRPICDDCIVRSVVDFDAQIHDAMNFIILAL